MTMEDVCIGWTTVANESDAEVLARGLVESGLAACVQIQGPVTSVYMWEDTLENSTEYRIAVKFPEGRAEAIEHYLHEHHPYDIPQWLAVAANHASPAYAQWVCGL